MHEDGSRIRGLGQALDQGEIRIGALPLYLDVDPRARATDMGVAQAMVGRGVEALVRVDQPDTGG